MQRIFLFRLRISKKKKRNGEWISVIHCFLFSLKGLSLTISNSAYPRLLVQGDASYPSMKEFYRIPSLALFIAAVFICRLLVNLRPASQEAVIWEEFDVVWLIWLFVCIFSQLNFNLIEPCRKFTYLCTLSLKRNASRVSYDTVSPRCTSWKSEKQKKCSW